MSSPDGTGVQLLSRELIDETDALMHMAKNLLAPDAAQVLAGFKSQVERIGRGPAGATHGIRMRPLRTRPPRYYEGRSRSGGEEIYAKITGTWEVCLRGAGSPKTKLAFTGKASTVVELWPKPCMWREEHCSASRLAMWRIELGAHDSPGCYFHVQVLGDRDDPPFPKSIPVPRLPSPFVTPMAAVEFVLGELFQDRWERRAGENHPCHKRWRAIQHQRWLSLLDWQKKVLDKPGSSPWMKLKAGKPLADQFLADSK